MKMLRVHPHTKKRHFSVDTFVKPVSECNDHKMSICEIAVVHLILGGLKKGEKLAEYATPKRLSLLHFNGVHHAIHMLNKEDAFAYCNNTLWNKISYKCSTEKLPM